MPETTISCPKCGFEQEPSEECGRCGIIIRKFTMRTGAGAGTSTGLGASKGKTSSKAPRISFRALRVAILLFLLLLVGMQAWLTKLRATDWDQPLRVVVYPINGDGSSTSSEYISFLEVYSFKSIEYFMEREAADYALELDDPVSITLAPRIDELPPRPPRDGNPLGVIFWSLKMRYWAYCADTYKGPAPDIQIFINYFDPHTHKQLDHSLGLEKGLIGVVNAFADRGMAERNNVVITHELLHTLGATDKYDLATDQPLYPDGYAEPDKLPLLPQERAEIMAGSVPLSENRADMPEGLMDTVIGAKTAAEIKWIE